MCARSRSIEFRIGTAETYDVIVQPREDRAFTIFVQAEDRSGFARATLAPRAGMAAPIPPLDPRPMRTMADMGMEHGAMAAGHGTTAGMASHSAHAAWRMRRHGTTELRTAWRVRHAGAWRDAAQHGATAAGMAQRQAPAHSSRRPGRRRQCRDDDKDRARRSRRRAFRPGRRVLRYTDLRALKPARRSTAALARHRAPSDRQHGALHVGLRRQEILRSAGADSCFGMASACASC